MAMTAWSAKVSTSSICFSVNGRDFRALKRERPDWIPLPRSSGTQRVRAAATELLRFGELDVLRVGTNVGNLNRLAFQRHRPTAVPRPGVIGSLSCNSSEFAGEYVVIRDAA